MKKKSFKRYRVLLILPSPILIDFFFKDYIHRLNKVTDLFVTTNFKSESYMSVTKLPTNFINLPIERSINIFKDLSALFFLIKFLLRSDFDLVISASPKAGFLGMIASFFTGVKKRIHIFQGEVWSNKVGLLRFILKNCDYFTHLLSTNSLCVSFSERNFLQASGFEITRKKITVLGKGSICGVDLKIFKPISAARVKLLRSKFNIREDAIVLLYLGRISSDKGVLRLAEAFVNLAQKFPNLSIVFSGPDEEVLIPQIIDILGRYRTRCFFTGFTDVPKDIIGMSDFLCLPSLREGFGNVIIEAAAMKIPAIGSNIYGIKDAIKNNKTGLLFDLNVDNDLENKISLLCINKKYRLRLGIDAYKFSVKHYDSNSVINSYLRFIFSVLER